MRTDQRPARAGGERPRADAYALLSDGRAVRLRAAAPEDWNLVHDFVATLGPDSLYRRFFGAPSDPGRRLADAVCAPVTDEGAGPTHGALLAVLEGEVVGLADWYRVGRSQEAEIAFAVSDRLHGRGVATLLAEHLMLTAERAGLRRLTAITQGDNRTMLGVFVALGVPVTREWDGGDCVLTIDLDLDSAARAYLADAAAGRERVADEASLRALLEPRAVVVVGDLRDPPTRRLLRDLEPFPGPVYHAQPDEAGEPLARNAPHPALVAAPPELAVVTTPPGQAVAAARRCAAWGVKALIVTAVGFAPEVGRELLEVCHEAGMRLVGPGSLGVANPRGARRLSALLSADPPRPGPAGVAVQSGGVGLALLSHLDRLGIGVSCFAAVGEKYDVSANDLLLLWEQDPQTRFGLLHVESFGNPRKFARTARRLSRRVPLLAVDPEQSASQARTALYAQAGIIAVPSLGALVCAAALAAQQPRPVGRRVAVFGNTQGMVSLAAQACLKAGLDVVEARDLTPRADGAMLAAAVAALAPPPHAVLVSLAPTTPEGVSLTEVADLLPLETVLLAVHVDQPESVAVEHTGSSAETTRPVPSYNDAATAAHALAALVRAAEASGRQEEYAAVPQGMDLARARALIEQRLALDPEGVDLTEDESAAVLAALGVGRAGTHAPDAAHAADLGQATRLTAWQDPVFGPVLTLAGARDHNGRTLLVPAGAREVAEVAERIAGRPSPPLADLVHRIAALVDRCPEAAAVRLTAEDAHVREVRMALAPLEAGNPYLRRLRRAPVE
ncbi:GNAT family N-acetyltransferase [Actinospica durhamensis]|uniref:GNAT family N-acetyltransferase n=1 Tax=Actinospica durhamensis TaxID=1508375 RepID=A0A941IT16_9ACTN|nr:GNAT family N-acetyltransferase [Actinospica durhamensis]MBR7837072.1 GNAT family N-acetyltransferase [Actinospica durhamensis]